MSNKIFFTLVLNFIFSTLIFSQIQKDPLLYEKNEMLKVIDKEYNHVRVYVFTDIGACSICNDNIPEIKKMLKGFKVEYIVFLNSVDQKSAENIKKEHAWDVKVIGDEFGIYKSYYKVKYQPFILILNNEGKVIDYGKLGSLEVDLNNLSKIINANDQKINVKELKQNLTEVKRVHVMYNGQPVNSSRFRELLFDSERNNYILINNRSCNITKIDSNGIVYKEIIRNDSINQICENQFDNVTWAVKDSLLFLYFINEYGIPSYHVLNIINDKFTQPISLKFDTVGSCSRFSYYSQYLDNTDKFVLFWNSKFYDNLIFNKNDPLSFIYDMDSKMIKSFDNPDPIYLKYKLSAWFGTTSNTIKKNELVTIQSFSNILKFWDFDGNFKKEIHLKLGSEFRKVDFDFKDTLSRADAASLCSKISRFNKILYDASNSRYLISYLNETYPEGIIDYLSDEIVKYVYIHICDASGNPLYDKDIIIPGYTFPFYFDENYIYCSEMNNKHHLDIVIYKLKTKA